MVFLNSLPGEIPARHRERTNARIGRDFGVDVVELLGRNQEIIEVNLHGRHRLIRYRRGHDVDRRADAGAFRGSSARSISRSGDDVIGNMGEFAGLFDRFYENAGSFKIDPGCPSPQVKFAKVLRDVREAHRPARPGAHQDVEVVDRLFVERGRQSPADLVVTYGKRIPRNRGSLKSQPGRAYLLAAKPGPCTISSPARTMERGWGLGSLCRTPISPREPGPLALVAWPEFGVPLRSA